MSLCTQTKLCCHVMLPHQVVNRIYLFSFHLSVYRKCHLPFQQFVQMINYKGESKVLQYFSNTWYNLSSLHDFAEFVKVTKPTGLWDAQSTWYSLNITHWICFYRLEKGFWVHVLRPSKLCLIVKILANQMKFLRLSSYCTLINFVFTFHSRNVVGWLVGWLVWRINPFRVI